jgi:type II secretory pathway pseudopilin PulG
VSPLPQPNEQRDACPPPQPVRRGEAAFSLIEVLVVTILFGVVSALVVQVLVQGSTGAATSRAAGISDASMRRARDAMSDDIARAVTMDNLDAAIRDDVAFAAGVRSGAPVYRPGVRADGSVDINAAPVLADVDEVRTATPTTFQVIVRDRCITWRAGAGGGSTFQLVRTAAPATNCGAATETRVFLSADADAKGLDRTPFEYDLICNPGVCPGSSATGSAPCRPFTVTGSVTGVRRRWIVGVDAQLFSLTSSNAGMGSNRGSVSQTIRSREVDAYREALGC